MEIVQQEEEDFVDPELKEPRAKKKKKNSITAPAVSQKGAEETGGIDQYSWKK